MITAAFLLAIAALLVWLVVNKYQTWPVPVLVVVIVLTLALIGVAVGILARGIDILLAAHEVDWAQVKSARASAAPEVVMIREWSELVKSLNRANPEVLAILAANKELARVFAGNYGPSVGVSTKHGEVPYEFIDEWAAVNLGRERLRPIGGPDGWETAGYKQKYASMFEHHLFDLHILVMWAGSKTAEWASADAKRRFRDEFYGKRINAMRITKTGEGNDG